MSEIARLLAHALTAHQHQAAGGRPAGGETTAVADVSAALRLIGTVRQKLDALEHDLLTTARSSGMTWRQIAVQLGYDSAQAAQQRTRKLAASHPGAEGSEE